MTLIQILSEHSPALPLLLALTTASLTLLFRRSIKLTLFFSLLGVFMYISSVIFLASFVRSGPLVYQFSSWPAPYGISFVADSLSLIMLVMTSIVALGILLNSIKASHLKNENLSYHSFFHFTLFGVTGAFLTGDLFNLFVWFEVTLVSSYILVTIHSNMEQTRAAITYVLLNLIGGTLMLLSIGGIYAITGTLNLADLSYRLSNPDLYNISIPSIFLPFLILFIVFALKSGLVPFHFWIPSVYQAAPSQVSAILSGITKKVGIYATIRIFFTILPSDIFPMDSILFENFSMLMFFGAILFILSISSIIFGGLAALAENNLDRILAYSSISQAGFILLPLSIGALFPVFKHLAIVATIIFMLNHSIAKSSLFLTSGYIKQITGSLELSELSGIHKRAPILSLSFLICMVSLIGIPPSIGFFGKLYLLIIPAHTLSSNPYSSAFIVSIIIIGTLLSLLYFTRIWNMVFWGEISPIVASVKFPILGQYLILFSTILLIAFGVGFDILSPLIDSAAFSAMDSSGYIDAVLHNK